MTKRKIIQLIKEYSKFSAFKDAYYIAINDVKIKYYSFVLSDKYLSFSDHNYNTICRIRLDNIYRITEVNNDD